MRHWHGQTDRCGVDIGISPRPESYSKADIDPQSKKSLDVGISGQEDPGNAKKNGGMFEKGILRAKESDHRANGNALEVKAIGNGHCHREGSYFQI